MDASGVVSQNNIYEKFESYRFHDDSRFEQGWHKIKTRTSSGSLEDRLLTAKLFYFSKYFYPVNMENYLSWKSQTSKTGFTSSKTSSCCVRNVLPTATNDAKSITNTMIGYTYTTNTTGDESTEVTSECVATNADCSQYCNERNQQSVRRQSVDSTDEANKEAKMKLCADTGASKTNQDETVAANSADIQDTTTAAIARDEDYVVISPNCKPDIDATLNMTSGKYDGEKTTDTTVTRNKDNAGKSPNCKQGVNVAQIITSDDSEPSYPKSFLEVLEYVQQGKEIPGLEELGIQPTKAIPTASQKRCIKKPWEKYKNS